MKLNLDSCKVGNKISYLLLFCLIAFSGNPVFTENKFFLIFFGIVLLSGLLFSSNKLNRKYFLDLVKYILFFIVIFLLQFIILDFVSWEGVFNFCFKILVGGIVVYLLGYSFREKYLKIMSFLGVISIVGYACNVIGIRTPAIIQVGFTDSILFYGTLDLLYDAPPMRNSGMFWEPGAYAGYLLLVPIFYMGDLDNLWNLHKKKCLVLFVALLTTLSTTGYLVFMLVGLYFMVNKTKYKFFVYLTLPVVLLGMYTLFMQVDFLGKKIESQVTSADSNRVGESFSQDRFGALLFDLYYIEKHPLIGNGFHVKTRYADHQYLTKDEDSGINAHGNGFSNFLASMGVLALMVIFYLIYKRYPFSKKDIIFIILIIIIVLQGEQFLNYPLFLILPFIMIPSANERSSIKFRVKSKFNSNVNSLYV